MVTVSVFVVYYKMSLCKVCHQCQLFSSTYQQYFSHWIRSVRIYGRQFRQKLLARSWGIFVLCFVFGTISTKMSKNESVACNRIPLWLTVPYMGLLIIYWSVGSPLKKLHFLFVSIFVYNPLATSDNHASRSKKKFFYLYY